MYLKNIDYKPSIISSIQSFYMILEGKRENEQMCKKFIDNFALTVRDYLWITAIGESRHAINKSQKYVKNIEGVEGRQSVYEYACLFEPCEENINSLINLFNAQWFDSSFGGEMWGTIVNHVGKYGCMSNICWLDIAIHLQHNSGSVFNKDLLFSDISTNSVSKEIESFLNYRANYDPSTFKPLALFSPLFNNNEHLANGCNDFFNWIWNNGIDYGNCKIDLQDNDLMECFVCGRILQRDEGNMINGKQYCPTCINKATKRCYICEKVVTSDILTPVIHNDTIILACNSCLELSSDKNWKIIDTEKGDC